MHHITKAHGIALVMTFFGFISTSISAELTLPAIINDNMVLQRDVPVPIWGWAGPGRKVTVTFAGRKARATADKDGRWMLRLKPMLASAKPQVMTIQSGPNSRTLNNVLIGGVWLVSGQSNMQWPVVVSNNP